MRRIREWIVANALMIALVFAGLMTALACFQTVRLDGLRLCAPVIGCAGPKGWIARAEAAEAKIARLAEQREAATRAALAARRSEEQALLLLSRETDNAINLERAGEAGRTERFIAAGGLRDPAACPGGPAAPGTLHGTGHGAGVREAAELDDAGRLQGPAIVGVTPDDVRICTDNTLLAEGWRALLLGLEARGQD